VAVADSSWLLVSGWSLDCDHRSGAIWSLRSEHGASSRSGYAARPETAAGCLGSPWPAPEEAPGGSEVPPGGGWGLETGIGTTVDVGR